MSNKFLQTLLVMAALIGPATAQPMPGNEDDSGGGTARQVSGAPEKASNAAQKARSRRVRTRQMTPGEIADAEYAQTTIQLLINRLLNSRENGIKAAQETVTILRNRALQAPPEALQDWETKLAAAQTHLDALLQNRLNLAQKIHADQGKTTGSENYAAWALWEKDNKERAAELDHMVSQLRGTLPSTEKPKLYERADRLLPRSPVYKTSND